MENRDRDDTATSIHPTNSHSLQQIPIALGYTALHYILFEMWSQKAAGNSIDHIAQMAHETLQKDVTYMSDKIKAVHIDFDWHWILGSGIALCAAIMANTGLNLQKLSHLENSYYDPFTRK